MTPILRVDDVFRFGGKYTSYREVVDRVKAVHKIIADEGVTYEAGIVCGTLDWFPGGVEFLFEAVCRGELIPQVHGWDHINYDLLPRDEIVDHLKRSMDVILTQFQYVPTKFFTPWGANSEKIKEASEFVGLEMVDCSHVIYPKRKFFGGKMSKNYREAVLGGTLQILIHWYEDKWFKPSDTHSLVKTLRTIKEDSASCWKE